MDAACAHIPEFHCVVLAEYVLHAESPLERFRRQLVHYYVISRAEDLARYSGGDTILNAVGTSWCERSKASRAWLDSAVAQVIRNVRGKWRINRSAQLRREREDAYVVVEYVVGDAKARTDGSRAARTRRIGDANPRAPIVLGSARLAEVNQPRYTRRLIQFL